MSENKVRFGLKNVHYSILTEGTDLTNNTFATPVAVPGAVSLSIESNVSGKDFHADNITYFKSFANNGYTGTLEMARISEAMLKAVWGMTEDSGVIYESSDAQPKAFALLFQIEGDQDEELYVLYRVLPTSKPSAGSQTLEETIDPGTQSFDFEALPLVTGPAYQKGLIKAHTGSAATSATRSAWFTAVTIPTSA